MQLSQIFIVICIAAGITALLTGVLIPTLKKKQLKQFIREEGPESHQVKSGTPTMGGLAIVTGLIISTLVAGKFSMDSVVMIVFTLLFALIGLADDYIKVSKKHNLGLNAVQKLILQILFAVALAIYMSHFSSYGTDVWVPIIDKYFDFGVFYVPFITFVVVAMANSVNLTDGLDGLAAGVTTIVSFFFAIVGMQFGHNSATVFSAALAGACLGFLLFNKYPAKLFMGDTGSMALGGALAGVAIIMKVELLLPIAGLVYVLEALSVIIQVVSFKTRGRRVFKMAPIHHHFEMCGMKEQMVVAMFWLGSIICCVLAFLAMNI